MIGAALNWIEDRTGLGKFLRSIFFERLPGGPRWRYVWGSTVVFAIVVEFITGIFLWLNYSPGATTAWESVHHIQNGMPSGAMLRGIHLWTADIMVVLLLFHLVQMVIDGAYRAPREVNFWLALASMGLVLAVARTGYMLPWDQEALSGTKVAMGYVDKTPLIGETMTRVSVGGGEYGQATITRFFALHAGVLPGLLILLLGANFLLGRRHGRAEVPPAAIGSGRRWGYGIAALLGGLSILAFVFRDPEAKWVAWVIAGVFAGAVALMAIRKKRGVDPDARPANFWPDQLLRNLIVSACFLAAVLFFVAWKGTSLAAPADTARSFDAARPDWYFMSLFTLLKFKPFAGEFGTMLGAVLIPGLVGTVFFLMPFIGRLKVGHWLNVMFLYLFLGGFVGLTAYGFYKDAKDDGYHSDLAKADAEAKRVEELIEAFGGIPPEGALALYQSDPLTHGPVLFAQNCASCHPFGGHDGTGQPLNDKPSAPDLKGIGSKKWIADLLTLDTYQSERYFGNTAFKEGEMAEELDGYGFSHAGMKEERSTAAADIDAVSAALAFEAGRRGYSPDPELVKNGFFLMEDDGDAGLDCASCHMIRGKGSGKGPDLTAYLSRDWLMDFVGNAAHERFYGEDNDRMPVFLDSRDQKTGEISKGKLDENSVGLIVDWLRGEWLGAE